MLDSVFIQSVDNLLKISRSRNIIFQPFLLDRSRRVVVKSKTAAKMANFKTVCSYFRDQLNNLINMLMTTEPSFIRCIVPNR